MSRQRILVIGGYGVFGSQLAQDLISDGHDVAIAGRSIAKARTKARLLGCEHVGLDRYWPVDEIIATITPLALTLVIDASGPFDPDHFCAFHVVKACADIGCAYFDFSDDPKFGFDLQALDLPTSRDKAWLSGVCSLPALSTCVAEHLAKDFDSIDSVEIAIFPGSASPKGKAVLASMLAQIGQTYRHRVGGRWQDFVAWSSPRSVQLLDGSNRLAFELAAPDILLLPDRMGAKSVRFRAGMLWRWQGWAIWILAQAKRGLGDWVPAAALPLLGLFVRLLAPLGDDRGAMSVRVAGQKVGGLDAGTTAKTSWIAKTWRVQFAPGEGGRLPAIPARALAKRLETLRPGARIAVGDLDVAEVEILLSTLDCHQETSQEDLVPLMARVHGGNWPHLPPIVRQSHCFDDTIMLSGTATIERGKGWWSGVIALVFGFPGKADDAPVSVRKQRLGAYEVWHRDFGGQKLCSTLSERDGIAHERFGIVTFKLGLNLVDQAVHYPVVNASVAGVPIPAWLLPVSVAREYQSQDRYCFDVAIHAPITQALVVRYRGHLDVIAPAARATLQ